MKIGIFGGSFNPVHLGHLELIDKIQAVKKFDKLFVIPCKLQPLKAPLEFSETDRFKMLQTALTKITAKNVELSDFELKSDGPSYSIHTVLHFKKLYPSAEILLIMGTDSFDGITKWHRIDELKKLCQFIVIGRKGHPGPLKAEIVELDLPLVSASEIRRKLTLGEPLSGLVLTETEAHLRSLAKV